MCLIPLRYRAFLRICSNRFKTRPTIVLVLLHLCSLLCQRDQNNTFIFILINKLCTKDILCAWICCYRGLPVTSAKKYFNGRMSKTYSKTCPFVIALFKPAIAKTTMLKENLQVFFLFLISNFRLFRVLFWKHYSGRSGRNYPTNFFISSLEVSVFAQSE